MTVALCFLTWNELEGCKIDVPMIDLSRFDQVYAVDGGSTDGTTDYLESRGVQVKPQPIRGYNQAYIFAFDQCRCDYLILFHPKGTVPVDDLYKFRDLFEQGHDLVIASRIVDGAVNEEDSRFFKPRKWFVKGLAILSWLIWGVFRRKLIWDVLHGFRGMRKKDFDSIDLLPGGVSADIEMVVRSYRKGISSVEFPTTEAPRAHGDTHFKAFSTGKSLLKYIWKELFRDA